MSCQNYFCRRTTVKLFNLLRKKVARTFPKWISPKVKVIAWLEFEHAYYNVEGQHAVW